MSSSTLRISSGVKGQMDPVSFDRVPESLAAPTTNSIERRGQDGSALETWNRYADATISQGNLLGNEKFKVIEYKPSSILPCCEVYQGNMVNTCCCMQQFESNSMVQAMVTNQTRTQVSCFEKYLLCGQNIIPPQDIRDTYGKIPTRKHDAGLPDKVQGVFFEGGKTGLKIAGMVAGLASVEPTTRTLIVKQYGPGIWAYAGPTTCMSSLGQLCRIQNPAYKFVFTEDFKSADITCLSNPCCCLPWLEPWCESYPGCLFFQMIEAENSVNGSHWHRPSVFCKCFFDNFSCCRKEPTPRTDQDDILKANGWGGIVIDGKMPLFASQYELYKSKLTSENSLILILLISCQSSRLTANTLLTTKKIIQ